MLTVPGWDTIGKLADQTERNQLGMLPSQELTFASDTGGPA